MSCRSLAVARSLLRYGSSCGAVPITPVPCDLSRLLDCPSLLGRPFFVKAFQRIRCPPSPVLHHLVISGNAACLPPYVPPCGSPLVSSVRPVLPWVMSSTPCPIAPRAVRLAVINRPALLVEWLGAGRDGTPSSSLPNRLATAACLLGREWRLRLFRLRRSACSFACRRLCR